MSGVVIDADAGWAQNKVAIITGASFGIGRRLAVTLGELGCKVVLVSRSGDVLRQHVKEIKDAGGSAIAVPADVKSVDDAEKVLDCTVEEFGTVDWLVNVAGIYPVTPVLDMSENEWDEVIDTNLKGTFILSKTVCRYMVDNHIAGKVVNTSSTSAIIARPGCAHYSSSKAGIVMFTKVLALEMAPHGILVNVVCPGLISTETVLNMSGSTPEAKREQQAKMGRIPLKRMGTPDEIVKPVLFLLSPAASYMTGSVLVVDGGYSLGIPSY